MTSSIRERRPARPGVLSVAFLLGALTCAACDDPKPAPAPVASATASVTKTAEPPPPPDPPKPKKQVVCGTGMNAEFTDPNLEAEVRRKLQKPTGNILVSELKNVHTLNLAGGKVNDLDPCIFPKLLGVKDIFLGPGDLYDLSPLSGLTQLESLRASINKVSDAAPLSHLTRMDRLDLGRTAIRDLKPIGLLVNLTELQLDDTEVNDVTPLALCTKLEKLSLKRTQVKDLGPLRDLKKLKFLYLEGTPVDDLSPLAPLVPRGLHIVAH